ncbi:TonB-dependent siderophore receptor [Sphingopyxis chilensis]|uniref:TonB-dependent siderophore receptor n=1 Tax=Sphingopyxis chilensis TaxID=180400 RepID=UPI002DDD4BB7|nr:TonB-dependent receptor [Sphingopyxis chilensis]
MRISFVPLAGTLLAAPPAIARDPAPELSWTPDIVVTGERPGYGAPAATTTTRTPTPVEKIPQSIQILTRRLIEEQDLQNLSAALVNVSGVTQTSQSRMAVQPALIRGFAVNYYIDGMPTYQNPAGIGDPATLVNVARIEIAKGPAATLYGGGSGAPLAGLINLISSEPLGRFALGFAVRAGRFDTRGAEADVNLPLGDRGGFRLAGMIASAGSSIDFVTSDRLAIFPTLAIDLGPDTRLVVRGRYNRLEQAEYAGLPVELAAPALPIDRQVFAGARDAPRAKAQNEAATATLTHRFGDRVDASLSANRTVSRLDEWGTFPYGRIGGTLYNFGAANLASISRKTFVTGTITGRLGDGALRQVLLAGIDYDTTRYHAALTLDESWGVVDYSRPLPARPFGVLRSSALGQTDRLRSIALFGQDQIAIGPRLDLTLGIRWTRLALRSGVAGSLTVTRHDKVTPRIGATYRIADGMSLFAGYSEGFKGVVAGGFLGIRPKPETSQAWEAGLKLAAPLKGLTGTLSLYRVTRQNKLTAHPAAPFSYLQTGEERARGAELDLVYEPAPSFSLLVNYALTDAKVTRDERLPVGDRLRDVPKHAGRLAVRYRFRSGSLRSFEVGAGVTAVSRRELALPNSVSVKGLALVDAQLFHNFGPVSIGLSVSNLLGAERFEPYQYLAGALVAPTSPRSAFMTLRKNF